MIAAALERHNGNRTHACEELQVSGWWLVAGGWWLVAGGWWLVQKIKTYGLGN